MHRCMLEYAQQYYRNKYLCIKLRRPSEARNTTKSRKRNSSSSSSIIKLNNNRESADEHIPQRDMCKHIEAEESEREREREHDERSDFRWPNTMVLRMGCELNMTIVIAINK